MQQLVVEDFPGLDFTQDLERAGLGACEVATDVVIQNGCVQSRQPWIGNDINSEDIALDIGGPQDPAYIWPMETISGDHRQIVRGGTGPWLFVVDGKLGIDDFSSGYAPITTGYWWDAAYYADETQRSIILTGEQWEKPIIYDGAISYLEADGLALAAGAYPRHVAVWGYDNRVVYANFNDVGAGKVSSSIWFSDPGEVDTFSANQYVELRPGEGGGGILGMKAYGEQLLVFKQKQMFVFYASTIDSGGNAVFHWRVVDLPSEFINHDGVVVTPLGVIVNLADGLYITNGGSFRAIGQQVKPFWVDSASEVEYATRGLTFMTEDPTPTARGARIEWFDGHLFVSLMGGMRMLVWNAASDKWVMWTTGSVDLSTAKTLPLKAVTTDGTPRLVIGREQSGTPDLAYVGLMGGRRPGHLETYGGSPHSIFGQYRFARGEHKQGETTIRRSRWMVRGDEDLGPNCYVYVEVTDGNLPLLDEAEYQVPIVAAGGQPNQIYDIWEKRACRSRSFQHQITLWGAAVHAVEHHLDGPTKRELDSTHVTE
jgi:hypothetical protein